MPGSWAQATGLESGVGRAEVNQPTPGQAPRVEREQRHREKVPCPPVGPRACLVLVLLSDRGEAWSPQPSPRQLVRSRSAHR